MRSPPKLPVNPNPRSSLSLSLLVRHGHAALQTSASIGDDGDLALLQDPSARFQHEKAGDNMYDCRILKFVPRG